MALIIPVLYIRFFCLARPKIQRSCSSAGSESDTFGPLGKKIVFASKLKAKVAFFTLYGWTNTFPPYTEKSPHRSTPCLWSSSRICPFYCEGVQMRSRSPKNGMIASFVSITIKCIKLNTIKCIKIILTISIIFTHYKIKKENVTLSFWKSVNDCTKPFNE